MNLKKKLKRTLAAGLAAVTMAGMVLPVMAEELTGVSTLDGLTPTIKITNRYKTDKDTDARAIYGAEFEVFKTGKYIQESGEITEKDVTRTSVGKLTIDKASKEGAKTDATLELGKGNFGRYQVMQTKRAPGMLANQSLKGKTKYDFLQAEVEFPMMKDGLFDSKQVFELHPKYDPALKSFIVNKKGDDKTTALNGAEFSLEYASKDTTALENYARTKSMTSKEAREAINKMTATSTNGQAVFENLPVGIYKLTETKTVDGYQVANKPMYFVIYGIDNLAVSADQVKVVALTSANFDKIVKEYKASADYSTKDDAVLTAIKPTLDKSNLTGEGNNIELVNYKTPDVTKEIVDGNKVTKANEVYSTIVAKTFQYKFTSNLPGDFNKYTTFKLTDNIDNRVDYKGNVVVKAGDTTLEVGKDYTLTEPTGKENKTLVITLTSTGITNAAGKATLTVTFDAAVNATAESNVAIDNKVSLNYVNTFEPNGNKDSEKVSVKIFKGNVAITKVDGSNKETKLENAEFQLFTDANLNSPYMDPTTNTVVKATTNKDGVATFENLAPGKYYLKETKAPEGYKLSSAFYEMEVKEDTTTGVKVTLKNNAFANNTVEDGNGGYQFTNFKTTSWLPDTGTRGLIPYALFAAAMSSMGLVVAKRRKENQ